MKMKIKIKIKIKMKIKIETLFQGLRLLIGIRMLIDLLSKAVAQYGAIAASSAGSSLIFVFIFIFICLLSVFIRFTKTTPPG